MANEIFVTYAPQDVDFARQLSLAFHNICIDPWIDIEDAKNETLSDEKIRRGIINANAFVFIISPDSLKNKDCLQQATWAIEEQKQLVPLFLRGENRDLFGIIEKKVPELGKINAIFFNNPEQSFQQSFNNLLQTIRGDYTMTNEVFISYSRRDIGFVKLLDQILRNHRIDPWVDWEDIPPGVDWRRKIFTGIENAHSFIFNISPDSVTSPICAEELNHAVLHGKRLIPVMVRTVEKNKIPKPLRDLHIIQCTDSEAYEAAFNKLVTFFDTDLHYARYHTRLQQRAITTWAQKGCDAMSLLQGSHLDEALAWLDESATKLPKPTQLQLDFIEAARQQREQEKPKLFADKMYQASYLINSDADAALKLYFEALELYPQNIQTLQYISYVYDKKGEYAKSIEYCQKAIELGDTHYSQLNMGRAHIYTYKEDEAMQWFEQAKNSATTQKDADNLIKTIEQFIKHVTQDYPAEKEKYSKGLFTQMSKFIKTVSEHSKTLPFF